MQDIIQAIRKIKDEIEGGVWPLNDARLALDLRDALSAALSAAADIQQNRHYRDERQF